MPSIASVSTFALLAAVASARFGQEQGNGAISAISALSDLGSSGQAATLAGGSIQFLLAAANPCGKLKQADQIITELGTSDRAVAAARGLVAAEQNFNPFVVSIPNICSDPSLPASSQLRGVVPLIDPAVVGSDHENANSNSSKVTPFSADGLSVAQIMVAQGFSNFTAVALDGTKQAASALGSAPAAGAAAAGTAGTAAAATSAAATAAATSAATSAAVVANAGSSCAPPVTITTFVTADAAAATTAAAATSVAAAAAAASSSSSSAAAGTCTGGGSTLVCSSPAVGAGAVKNAVTGNFDGFVKSTIAGLDFGLCVPTMKFEAGLDGRASTANTFQAIDPQVNKGQEEALNPSIITNRIHDQMTNVCGANQAAKDAVAAAATKVAALGTRDATTANTWNTLLGFDGTNINPDNAPQTGLVGHT
ncbi:hypothetical protein CMQ_2019 [Grosmannia clavigera kw1407]|uniref:Circumsporozoite protein n=1 Tax=Grosmannia clavigera (strain kw1407 / UAMH 11150) TaxID=655863 RepID=F0XN11_GROCL|nr:uncharacterized protein CMQ_2019 [Grosmannia clavigera kw1407]EFX00938.1 hypothetical protein CMQ_2019 [Grosmannia clavigera kw1407]